MVIANIIALAKENLLYRRELITSKYSQLVLMCIEQGDEIGLEVHDADQILVIVQGVAEAILDGKQFKVNAGSLVFVKAGTAHNIINNGNDFLKLYTIYAPPQHKSGTIHKTKKDEKSE